MRDILTYVYVLKTNRKTNTTTKRKFEKVENSSTQGLNDVWFVGIWKMN